MQSPIHSQAAMIPAEIEPGLRVYQCPESKGYWIPLAAYSVWQERHRDRATPLPQGYKPDVEDDSKRPTLLCPESGCLLQRFRVGHGFTFRIDRSPVSGGMWLDRGEWQALKSKKLHESLPDIFTAPYQKQIRSDELTQVVAQTFRERLGEEDFAKALQFKEWMLAHPRSRDIVCFLLEREEERPA